MQQPLSGSKTWPVGFQAAELEVAVGDCTQVFNISCHRFGGRNKSWEGLPWKSELLETAVE